MTIYNYYEHKFRKEGKYKCECGFRFKRIETTTWTENPFNKRFMNGQVDELNAEAKQTLADRLKTKKCPKCQKECPVIIKTI